LKPVIRNTIGGGVVVVGAVIAHSLDAFTTIGDLFRSDASVIAQNSKQDAELNSLQRQLSQVQSEINQGDKNATAISELENQFRIFSANSGVELNKDIVDEVVRLRKRIAELETKLSLQPSQPTNGVILEDVKQIVAQAKQQAKLEVKSELSKVIDDKLKSLPTTNDGAANANIRNIQVVKRDCAHIPSLGNQFTLKLRKGSELCWNPSVLWLEITGGNTVMTYKYSGGDRGQCSGSRPCYIGIQNKGNRFELRLEKVYREQDQTFYEVNFLKI